MNTDKVHLTMLLQGFIVAITKPLPTPQTSIDFYWAELYEMVVLRCVKGYELSRDMKSLKTDHSGGKTKMSQRRLDSSGLV